MKDNSSSSSSSLARTIQSNDEIINNQNPPSTTTTTSTTTGDDNTTTTTTTLSSSAVGTDSGDNTGLRIQIDSLIASRKTNNGGNNNSNANINDEDDSNITPTSATSSSHVVATTPPYSSPRDGPSPRSTATANLSNNPFLYQHKRSASSSTILDRLNQLKRTMSNDNHNMGMGGSSSTNSTPIDANHLTVPTDAHLENGGNNSENNNNNNNSNNNSNNTATTPSGHNSTSIIGSFSSPFVRPKEHFESVDFYSTLSFAPEEEEYDDDESFLMHSINHYSDGRSNNRRGGMRMSSNNNNNNNNNSNNRGVIHSGSNGYSQINNHNNRFYDNDYDSDDILTRYLGPRLSYLLYYVIDKFFMILSYIYYPFYKITKGVQVKVLIFLIVLGVVASLTTLSIDTCIYAIENAHVRFGQMTNFYFFNYMFYTMFAVISSMFAAACVHYISNNSAGSGLPEMKSILSGNHMERYLTMRTMVGKSLGVIAGLGAGLQIGRLGPFVHLSSCIANMMLKLKFFRKLRKREFERISMLSAACASGVASTFGSPIGGVLFSIEVTSSTYPVSNLWRCIVVTLFGSLFFYMWRKIGIISAHQISLFSTDFPPFPYEIHEIFLFILVGIICGFLGSFYIFVLTKMIQLRKSIRLLNDHRYYLVGAVALITALISFPAAQLMRFSPNYTINLLFGMEDLAIPNPLLHLSLVAVARFILTPISLALPIPSGLFSPVFAIGAFLGRLFGEIVKRTLWENTIPAYYAVVGASALSVGVTRAMSTIVVVFELTGQLSLMLPVILASIFAVGVANFFNEGIYDRLMKIRGLPLLNDIIQDEESSKVTAKDIMRTEINFICSEDTIETVQELLTKTSHTIYPVVDSKSSMILVGSVKRNDLEIMINNAYQRQLEGLHISPETPGDLELNDYSRNETAVQRIKDASEPEDDRISVGSFVVPLYSSPTLLLKSASGEQQILIPLDAAPMSTPVFTPLPKIHFLFLMLRLSHSFVTVAGKLVGVIAKKDLIILSET